MSCGCGIGTLESESVSSFHGCPECPLMWCKVMLCVVDRILCREHSKVWLNMSDFGVYVKLVILMLFSESECM